MSKYKNLNLGGDNDLAFNSNYNPNSLQTPQGIADLNNYQNRVKPWNNVQQQFDKNYNTIKNYGGGITMVVNEPKLQGNPYDYAGGKISGMPNSKAMGNNLTFDDVSSVGLGLQDFDKHAEDYFNNLVEQTYMIKSGMNLMPYQDGYVDPMEGSKMLAQINKLFNDYKDNAQAAFGYATYLEEAALKGNKAPGGVSKTTGFRANEADMLIRWKNGDPNIYLVENGSRTALYDPNTEAIINLDKFGEALTKSQEYIKLIPENYQERMKFIGEGQLGTMTKEGTGLSENYLDFEYKTSKDGRKIIETTNLKFKDGGLEGAIEAAKNDPIVNEILRDNDYAESMWVDIFGRRTLYNPNDPKQQEELRGLIAKKSIHDLAASLGIGTVQGEDIELEDGTIKETTFMINPKTLQRSTSQRQPSGGGGGGPTDTYATVMNDLIEATLDVKTADDFGEAFVNTYNQLLSETNQKLILSDDGTQVILETPSKSSAADAEPNQTILGSVEDFEKMDPKDLAIFLNNKTGIIPTKEMDAYFNQFDPIYDSRFDLRLNPDMNKPFKYNDDKVVIQGKNDGFYYLKIPGAGTYKRKMKDLGMQDLIKFDTIRFNTEEGAQNFAQALNIEFGKGKKVTQKDIINFLDKYMKNPQGTKENPIPKILTTSSAKEGVYYRNPNTKQVYLFKNGKYVEIND